MLGPSRYALDYLDKLGKITARIRCIRNDLWTEQNRAVASHFSGRQSMMFERSQRAMDDPELSNTMYR